MSGLLLGVCVCVCFLVSLLCLAIFLLFGNSCCSCFIFPHIINVYIVLLYLLFESIRLDACLTVWLVTIINIYVYIYYAMLYIDDMMIYSKLCIIYRYLAFLLLLFRSVRSVRREIIKSCIKSWINSQLRISQLCFSIPLCFLLFRNKTKNRDRYSDSVNDLTRHSNGSNQWQWHIDRFD